MPCSKGGSSGSGIHDPGPGAKLPPKAVSHDVAPAPFQPTVSASTHPDQLRVSVATFDGYVFVDEIGVGQWVLSHTILREKVALPEASQYEIVFGDSDAALAGVLADGSAYVEDLGSLFKHELLVTDGGEFLIRLKGSPEEVYVLQPVAIVAV